MIKKVHITESERRKILSLHQSLNEETSKFKISGVVVNKDKKEETFVGADVSLYSGTTLLNRKKTDAGGIFTFEDVLSGVYIIKSSAIIEGFPEKKFEVEVKNKNVQITLELDRARELEEVTVMDISLTSLNFNFTDTNGKKVDNVNIQLYRDPTTLLKILPKMETTNGSLNIFVNSHDDVVKNGTSYDVKNFSLDGFFDSKGKKVCKDFKNLYVVAKTTNFISQKTKIEFCLNNAEARGKSDTLKDEKTNKEIGKKYTITTEPTAQDGYEKSNTFEIKFSKPTISGTFKVLNDLDVSVPNSVINLYSDSSKTKLVKTLTTDSKGSVTETFTASDFELLDDNEDVVSKIILYAEISQTGYNPYFEKVKLRYDKTNDIEFKLKSVKPPKAPKPAKPMSFRECKKEIRKYYRNYITTMKKGGSIEDAGGEQFIMDSREQVKWCYINYQKRYSDKYQRAVRRLRNTATNYDAFEINFTIQQQQDIYKENYTMSLRNSIRKVIFEQNEINESNFTEKKIIKNRLNFVLENSNRRNFKNNLLSESKKLVRNGYNRKFVKESFMDIMTGMKDPKTFLTDVKNQLGQKIADTVKDKQQEHELIMGAFNELDPSVVERAFKENKTDELSEIIATKALENYKTQFGEGGIMGSLMASVDLSKFKTEVSKLLQTAIDQMNTEMTQKVEKSVSDEETE